jgi:signal transduction histidine kinase
MARIQVKDEGIGIDRETMQQLFRPFSSMKDGGTGLGLFITRRIVTEHNGDLRVKSKAGGGSIFEILLPRADGTQMSAAAPVDDSNEGANGAGAGHESSR